MKEEVKIPKRKEWKQKFVLMRDDIPILISETLQGIKEFFIEHEHPLEQSKSCLKDFLKKLDNRVKLGVEDWNNYDFWTEGYIAIPQVKYKIIPCNEIIQEYE